MRNHILSIGLLASGLVISDAAIAGPVTVKDWSLNDSGSICVASTERTISGQKFRLELSFDKSGFYPVEVWIREVAGPSKIKAFRFITEVKPVQHFAFAPLQDATGKALFWQVPSDTDSLISYIKRQTRLLVHGLTPNGAAAPTSTAVDFSLRGSSAVVDSLISQCNRGMPILKSEFERSFTPPHISQLDPLKLESEKTAQLRNLFLQSLQLSQQKSLHQKELATLNTQYAKQIQELGRLTGTLDELTQKELTGLQSRKSAIEGRIASLNQEIKRQQAEIEKKEAQVVAANAVYEQAWKVIAPFEPEHRRLSDDLQTSQNDLNNRESELREIDSQIQSKIQLVSRYESEIESLRSELSRKESETRSARMDVDNTETNYRRFDLYREQQERLTSHPVFQYCRYNHSNECRSLLRAIESNTDIEVSNVSSRLSDNYNQARNRLIEFSDAVARIDTRIRTIQYEIPNLRNEISSLRAQRPSVESSVVRFRSEVSAKSSALQSYDRSVGYAEKKAELERTASIVVGFQRELEKMETNKSVSQRNLQQQHSELAGTDQRIQEVLVQIRETQDRSSELSKALAPYFNEKGRLEGLVSNLEKTVSLNKQEFSLITAPN